MLERAAFLASLAQHAAEARAGDGRLVLVSGEAGVGKTALVEQLEAELPDAEWAWSACDGLFTPRPLGPLFDLAERLGGELRAAAAGGADRDALFATLLRQLSAAAGHLRVVVVEDVHWADEATLDLLRYVGRRLRGLPVLLVATFRDDGLAPDHPLRVVLGFLATQRTTRRLALPPLSEAAVDSLAAASPVAPDELFRLTGGNPFFVTEVLAAGGGALPVSAREAVLARVARLDAGARRLVEYAALAGARIDPPLLERLVPDAAAGLEAGLAGGVLTADEAGLRFRHEISRLAVADAVPAHRRGRMHADLLEALHEIGSEDDARLAHHAEGAGNAIAVVVHAPRAARKAAALASHREAVAQYERALRFATHLDPAAQAALWDGLGYETSLVDRWADSAAARQAALPLWRWVGDRTREGDSLRALSRALYRLCRGAEAEEAAQEALVVLSAQSPAGPELAWAHANLAVQQMLHRRLDSSIVLARQGQQLAERLGDATILSDALNSEACATAFSRREWRPTMLRALEVAVEADREEQAGRAYANLHGLSCAERRYGDADRWFTEGVAYCDDHDVATFGTCLRGERTNWLDQRGRWDEAVALSTALLADPVISPVNRINPLISLGRIRARRGEAEAAADLDEAARLADGTGEPDWIAQARLARAEAAWLTDQPQAAADELARVAEVADRCDPWVRGAVAVWRSRLGRAGEPAAGLPEPRALELAGDPQGAAAAWRAVGCPYEAGLALAGSDDEAALREALAVFDELGALVPARRTRRLMRRRGLTGVPVGPRAATRQHRLGLTRREQEVLALVAAGLPNGDISRRLFISQRTVDHHVSALLTKMGVASRTAAAREAERLGLLDA
nr:helix-turn-helix transcriptional regulator [Petropleomorpha daqingensis]